MKYRRIASIIRIEPKHVILLWWDGKAHNDLITFDEAGFKLISESLGGNNGLQNDAIHQNIRRFLESWLLATKYDFKSQGKLHLTEKKVRRLLHLK